MILYLLLKAILYILGVISYILGGLIPDFPLGISNVLDSISVMLQGGISFLSYFFNIIVVVSLISLVISFHGFSIVKDALMKVIGHFFGN